MGSLIPAPQSMDLQGQIHARDNPPAPQSMDLQEQIHARDNP